MKTQSRHQQLVPFVAIFSEFQTQEQNSENDSQEQKKDQRLSLAYLCRTNRHGHGEAAAQEYGSHNRADVGFQQTAAGLKILKVDFAVDDITSENSAEKQHLGCQENPHAQFG